MVALATIASFRLRLRAMLLPLSLRSNKLGAGNPARWVFGGGEGAIWGKFAQLGGRQVAGSGPIEPVTARVSAPIGMAAGPAGLAASTSINQALSRALQRVVAPLPSHRACEVVAFQHVRAARRLIANLRTRAARLLDLAQLGALLPPIRVGGAPLSPIARAPHDRSAGRTRTWENRAAPCPSATGCDHATGGEVRNIHAPGLGSGVSDLRNEAGLSGAADRGAGRVETGVRVKAFAHRSVGHGKGAEAARDLD